ncbi:S8 family peptidase [Anaerocolumna sp. MB42-C2]|uniref:S8 family peptidase n=1 Tax=Anaerocolumna sp. MB42-C2 TaxID=3070997 RepID=UPI0027DEB444|nr:S8 family peptidase [Anaerocolumna sp. MB42-C2]WMJ88159.1 S8 family peptidase [Anaerocolumna sp. MB42-C2]
MSKLSNIFLIRKGIRLVPFRVKEIIENVNEIPQGVQMIQAPAIWDKSRKGEGVVIAVIDTGCQIDHPDLRDRIIGGRNFTKDFNGDPNNFTDNNGHGTHVAGTIAASENSNGVLGVAPMAKLLILKVLGKSGGGNYQNIIEAINYAIKWRGPKNEKVRIISMSLGGDADVPKLHDAVIKAVNNNILVVCASGNNGDNNFKTDELNYPAAYNEAVSVGAVDFNKKITKYSNSNNNVDLVAPGNEIISTYLDSKYAKLSGTSMATPHVSGAAALIINMCEAEYGRTLTETEIYAQLVKHTTSLGFDKRNEGNGMLYFSK